MGKQILPDQLCSTLVNHYYNWVLSPLGVNDATEQTKQVRTSFPFKLF